MADYVTTGTPYNIPSPVEAMPPDIPKDLATLARSVHDNLALIDKGLAAVKLTADGAAGEVAKLNTLTKPPTVSANSTTAYVKAAANFQIRTAYLVRWGYMCMLDVTIRTLIDRGAGTTGSVTVDMATWVTTQRPTINIAYPLTSVDGLMAMGWASSGSLRLQSLEAAGKWVKNTDIRFTASYLTNVART